MRHLASQPSGEGLTDDRLIEQAHAGHRDSLIEFLRRHWSDLAGLAQRYAPHDGRCSHGPEDILSTVVRQVLSLVDRGKFAPRKASDAHGLVRTVMRRAIAKVFRRRRAESAMLERHASQRPASQVPPTESTMHRLSHAEVAAIVGDLSDDDYQLLLLRLEGAKFDVIATRLGCTAATARQRWRTLRKRLGFDGQLESGSPE